MCVSVSVSWCHLNLKKILSIAGIWTHNLCCTKLMGYQLSHQGLNLEYHLQSPDVKISQNFYFNSIVYFDIWVNMCCITWQALVHGRNLFFCIFPLVLTNFVSFWCKKGKKLMGEKVVVVVVEFIHYKF